MKLFADMHVHSKFSIDGTSTMGIDYDAMISVSDEPVKPIVDSRSDTAPRANDAFTGGTQVDVVLLVLVWHKKSSDFRFLETEELWRSCKKER